MPDSFVEDLDQRSMVHWLSWLSDLEVIRFVEARNRDWTAGSLKEWYREQKKANRIGFQILVHDAWIGNLFIGPIHPRHRRADISLMIGQPGMRGHWYGREALKLAADYAFGEMWVHKFTAGIYAPNVAAIRCYEKAGFTKEAVLPKHVWWEGHWTDVVLMGRFRKTDQ